MAADENDSPRARGRAEKTLADYMAIGISPLLIMALAGSLAFFLLELAYAGQYSERLRWILFWFVFASVLVGRISIEQGSEHAAAFGLALAAVTGLSAFRLAPDGAIVALVVLAVIWWSVHRLTYDCTLIDDSVDSSGQGLLQASGLETSEEGAKRKKRPWWKSLVGEPEGSRAPGTWVVYFSLAALPLFGIGQVLIPATESGRRAFAFSMLLIYVASALALLLTTSFLGLRRYLRQRRLKMPLTMAGAWLGTGLVLIGLILGACWLLPRPENTSTAGTFWRQVADATQKASPFAQMRNGAGEGEGKRIAQPNPGQEPDPNPQGQQNPPPNDPAQQARDQQPREDQQPGEKKPDDPNAQENQPGEKPGQQNQPGQPGQKQEPGQQPPDQDPDKQPGDQKPGEQPGQQAGQQPPDQQQKPGEQKPDQQPPQQQGQNGQQPPPPDQRQAQNDPNAKQDPAAQKARPNPADAKPEPPPPPPPPSPTPEASSWFSWLAANWQTLFYGLMALAFLGFLIWKWRAVCAFLGKLWNEILSLFGLFSRRREEPAEKVSEAEAALARLRPFSECENPFRTGSASRMKPSELLRVTFDALQAWAIEFGPGRRPELTPLEFGQQIQTQYPQMVDAREVAQLYAAMVYASAPPERESLEVMRRLWGRMESLQTQDA